MAAPYSQAFLLRRRLGFKGEIRATGDVLVDQLVQMQRTGFDVAVLRADQNLDFAQRQLDRFQAFTRATPSPYSPLPRKGWPYERRARARRSSPHERHRPHARPSAEDFDAKLQAGDQSVLLPKRGRADYCQAAMPTGHGRPRITQASSLGAEDVVISHLINSLQLDIGIFVLETGMLHAETLALLEQFKASPRAGHGVHPGATKRGAVCGREGKDAMYKSIALRKACCGIRKMEPLERALAGKEGLDHRPAPRAVRRPRRCAAG
jgi:hypothetical protein